MLENHETGWEITDMTDKQIESVVNQYHQNPTTLKIERVAAYVRVSTTEQKLHGLSLDAQRDKLTEYAAAYNMKIVEWYLDEGVSGRKPIKKRPELQRMIRDAEEKKFDKIIFIKLDRFFRSVAEYHECMKRIDPIVWTATEEKYDLSTANGRAFVNMKLTIAELEADQTGERIKIVNEYKIKSGMPLFGTKCMPFCYAVSAPDEGERHKYIVKQEKEIMEDLIAHFTTTQSIRSATLYINKKYNRKFHYNSITNVLKNEMICGSYRGNPNYCEPYITREEFDNIQTIIKRNPRWSTDPKHSYIFSGLIKCPHCGRNLTGAPHVTTRPKTGKRYQYYGYRCQDNRNSKTCTFSAMPFENIIERQLLEKLDGIIARKKAELIKAEQSESMKPTKYDLPALQAELERLNYSWQKGRIKSMDEYDRRYDDLMEKIDLANAERAEKSNEPDYEKIQSILSCGWKEAYATLDDEHKRAFWRSFVEEIHLNWGSVVKEVKDVIFF